MDQRRSLFSELSAVDTEQVAQVAAMNALASFVPVIVRQHFVTRESNGQLPTVSPLESNSQMACAVVLDLSGFTKYSEKCSKEGASGVEKLTDQLNSAMNRMVSNVEIYGGDILKFAGDAVIVMFSLRNKRGWITKATDDISRDAYLKQICYRAILSTLLVHRAFEGDPIWSIHAGIAVGDVRFLHLGGYRRRYEFLSLGDSFLRAFRAMDEAKQGETCATGMVRKLCDDGTVHFEILSASSKEVSTPGTEKFLKDKTFKVIDMKPELELRTQRYEPMDMVAIANKLPLEVLRQLKDNFGAFTHQFINKQADSATADLSASLGQIRTVATLFIKLDVSDKSKTLTDIFSTNASRVSSRLLREPVAATSGASERHTESAASISSFSASRAVRSPSDAPAVNMISEVSEEEKSPTPKKVKVKVASPNTSQSTKFAKNSVVPDSGIATSGSHHLASPGRRVSTLNSAMLGSSLANSQKSKRSSVVMSTHAIRSGVQPMFLMIQEMITQNKGLLRQFLIDDKGCVLIVVFGCHGSGSLSLGTDAITTAMEIKNGITEYGVVMSAGVTTGSVFCGSVGNSLRREYAVIGNPVNFAARLMSLGLYDIIVDEATMDRNKGAFKFETLPKMKFKGLEEPVHVYRPLRKPGAIKGYTGVGQQIPLIGHIDQKNLLVLALQDYQRHRKNGLSFILGPAGIGKTVLIDNLRMYSEKYHAPTLLTKCTLENKMTPYFPFQSLLTSLLFLQSTYFLGLTNAGDRLDFLKSQFLEIQSWGKTNTSNTHTNGHANRVSKRNYISARSSVRKRDFSFIKSADTVVEDDMLEMDSSEEEEDEDEELPTPAPPTRPSLTKTSAGSKPSLSRTSTKASAVEVAKKTNSKKNVGPAVPGTPLRLTQSTNTLEDTEQRHFKRLLKFIPLLSDILGADLNLPRSIQLQLMDREERAKNLGDLIFFILTHLGQVVLLIEDVHWMDALSIDMVRELATADLLVICTIGKGQELHPKLQNMMLGDKAPPPPVDAEDPVDTPAPLTVHTLELTNISRGEMEKLLNYNFGVTERWPDVLMDFIMQLGRGMPYYSLELVRALISKSVISINEGKCELQRADGTELDTVQSALGTLEQLIIARFDELSGDEQLVLKSGSVIGDVFFSELLQHILPLTFHGTLDDLEGILDQLCEKGFLRHHNAIAGSEAGTHIVETSAAYKFESNFSRSVTYSLVLVSKKKLLHRKIAQRMEQLYNDDLDIVFPRLAYHFQEAGELERGLKYLEMAAKASLHQGFHEKVVNFLEQALQLGKTAKMSEFENLPTQEWKLIQWTKQIVVSLAAMGNHSEAERYREEAMRKNPALYEKVPPLLGVRTKQYMRRKAIWHKKNAAEVREAIVLMEKVKTSSDKPKPCCSIM